MGFNITNCSRGINGVMVDLAGIGAHVSINAGDFVFKVGTNNTPSSWTAGPAPTSVAVSLGGGVSGSDRVEITWSSTISVRNAWLEVQVLANATTGLAANPNFGVGVGDVFFWGNKIADRATGALNAGNFITNTTDAAQVNATLVAAPGATITNPSDFNRDKGGNHDRQLDRQRQPGKLEPAERGQRGVVCPGERWRWCRGRRQLRRCRHLVGLGRRRGRKQLVQFVGRPTVSHGPLA